MNAKGLVKAYGLSGCVDRMNELTVQQVRGLAKIADEYGKAEFHSKVLGELQARRAARRAPRKGAPGSIAGGAGLIGGVADPYAWYSLGSDGRVILHTWRRPQGGRMDGWRLDAERWTLGTRWSGPDMCCW